MLTGLSERQEINEGTSWKVGEAGRGKRLRIVQPTDDGGDPGGGV